jgi:proton-dependent oligopeptide transporter, POT family
MTGVYDPNWNAGLDAVMASSFGSISVAVAYTTPFMGAFFADKLFGDYNAILVGALVFYLPGITIIALTTIPGLLGDTFNRPVFLPMGTGSVKSVVNVFGAKQFHPLLQSSLIEGLCERDRVAVAAETQTFARNPECS